MMKIKNAKSPMKHTRAANSRLRGTRPVCFEGQFIGYTGKNFRELRAVANQARHGQAAALFCQANRGKN
jgi:hypothetical protein